MTHRAVQSVVVTAMALTACAVGYLSSIAGDSVGGDERPYVATVDRRSGAEQVADETESRRKWLESHREWIASLKLTDSAARDLPEYPMLASYTPGSESLDEAVAAADLVVVGVVKTTTYHDDWTTTVDIAVTQSLKGHVDELAVRLAGGPQLSPADGRTIMVSAENAPLLYVGDEVLLLLQRSDDKSAEFSVQSYSGWYKHAADSQRWRAAEGNRFAKNLPESFSVLVASVAESVEAQ